MGKFSNAETRKGCIPKKLDVGDEHVGANSIAGEE